MNRIHHHSRPALVLLAALVASPVALYSAVDITGPHDAEPAEQIEAHAYPDVNNTADAGAGPHGARTGTPSTDGSPNSDSSARVNRQGLGPPRGDASAQLRRDAIRVDLNSADAVNLRLQTATVTGSVESATFETRDRAVALAQRGADDGREITDSIRNGARTLGDSAREGVDNALNEAERARQRLNGAISLAQSSNEREWDDRREALAERYEDYAVKLEDAREAAVENGVTFSARVAPQPAG